MLRVRDIRSGVDLLDRLEGCRWTSVAWLAEGNSFYYVRPPLPPSPRSGTAAAITSSIISSATRSPPIA